MARARRRSVRAVERKPAGLGAWWSLLRGEHGLITLVAVVVAELLVTRRFGWELLLPAFGPTLVTWGAFALNDYHGYASDRALRRMDRPLVAGTLSRGQALGAALVLLAAGLALAWPTNGVAFGLLAAYVFGSLVYDPVLKKLPFVGNVFIASTMAVPFLYGSAVVTRSLAPDALVGALWWVAFLVGVGRELLKTLADVRGDRRLGAHTLPMLIGPRATVRLAALFLLAGAGASLLPLALRFSPAYALLISLSNIATLASVEMSLENPEEATLRRCRDYTLGAMGIGVLAFAALALGL